MVTLIAVALWIAQSCKNLHLLRSLGRKFTPFGAAMSFFIPILNLVLPYMAVMEVWRASDPTAVRSPMSWKASPYAVLIRIWWLCMIAAILFPFVAVFGGSFDMDPEVQGLTLSCVCCILLAGAAALLIFIIRDITIRQRERYERLYSDPE